MTLPCSYSARPAALADAAAIAGLQNAESRSVLGVLSTSADQVRAYLSLPTYCVERDTLIVAASDGSPAAYAEVYDPAPHVQLYASVSVHPRHTGKGIGGSLACWAERRGVASAAAAPPDARVTINQEVWSTHEEALCLLRDRDYRATRRFSKLRMRLDRPPATPQLPPGIAIRTFRGAEELPAVVRAETEAFRDHWGFVEQPFDDALNEWEAWISTNPRYDPAQWLLAVDGDEVLGIAIANGATNEDTKMAYVDDLGVRREWRRQGVGTALLLSLLHVLRGMGFERAALDVDADSLTGATRLYERVGFRPFRQSINMELELRPGRDLRTQDALG